MIITADIPPPAVASSLNREGVTERRFLARAPFLAPPNYFQTYHLNQTYFPWNDGKSRIKLFREPVVRLDVDRMKATIPEWGIEVNISDAGLLPREMVRQFLSLRAKAQNNSISESEAILWSNIIEAVDMRDFALVQARPRYVEGKLLVLHEIIKVLWHDNTESRINYRFRNAFYLVNEGEEFTAYAKFGEDDMLLQIEDVLPSADKRGQLS